MAFQKQHQGEKRIGEVRRLPVGLSEPLQRASRSDRPAFQLLVVPVVRVVRGFLALVATETTAEGLLALRSLAHEATCALRAAESASALGSHAEATKARLHARGSLTVPGAWGRLVAKLAEGSGC